MVQCKACGGTYAPVLADGMLYFHVCPPLSVPELHAALAAKTLALNPSAQARYDQAVADDVATPPAKGAPTRVDQFLATLVVTRPNARNENVTQHPTKPDETIAISEGAGVLELPPADAPPAATVTSDGA
jgi:hypothetical protein